MKIILRMNAIQLDVASGIGALAIQQLELIHAQAIQARVETLQRHLKKMKNQKVPVPPVSILMIPPNPTSGVTFVQIMLVQALAVDITIPTSS